METRTSVAPEAARQHESVRRLLLHAYGRVRSGELVIDKPEPRRVIPIKTGFAARRRRLGQAQPQTPEPAA